MPVFILIPGAWHGAWCWQDLAPLLRQAGARVLCPDLTGMGANRDPLPRPALPAWSRQIAQLAEAQDEKPILLGHSRGGLIASQAAEHASPHIAGLIYLAAFALPNGLSISDSLRQSGASDRVPLDASADGRTLMLPRAEAITRCYNRTDPAVAAWAAARLCAEPADSFTTPPSLTASRYGSLPRAYLRCAEDRMVSPALQDWLLARTQCDPVITLNGDHSPFLSAPAELAAAILTCAQSFTSSGFPSRA